MGFEENRRALGLALPGMNARRMSNKPLFTRMGTAGQLNVSNYQAPTGIGRFDGTFNTAKMTYEITIKVNFVFLDPAENDKTTIKWDSQSKLDYIRDTMKVVEDEWSGRYLIKCIKDGWGDVSATVVVKIVEKLQSEAHFTLKAKRLPDTGRSSGGGVSWGETPPAIDVDSLGLKPKYQQKLQAQQFNMREKLIEESLFKCGCQVLEFDHKSSTITVNDKVKLNQLITKLKTIVKPDVTGIKLCIYGATSGFDIHKRAKSRADAVLQHIKLAMPDSSLQLESLTALTVDQKALAIKSVQKHKKNLTTQNISISGCILFVYTDKSTVRESITDYIVMVHEFGHTLGLPDEYTGRLHPRIAATKPLSSVIPETMQGFSNLTGETHKRWIDDKSERIKKKDAMRQAEQQLGFARLQSEQGGSAEMPLFTGGESMAQEKEDYEKAYSAFNIEVARLKKLHGKDSPKVKQYEASASPKIPLILGSSSIMHSGMEILPAHYLTIWSSLVEATRAFILPNEWQIDPTPLKP